MTKRGRKLFACCIAVCLLITQAIVSGAVFAQSSQTDRLSGSDRYKTAAAISLKGWPGGSQYAVIARGDDFADALCAGPLAKKFNAPILLTEPGVLNTDTLNELKRLGAKYVFIAGGVGAVSQNVENALKSAGIENVERIWGSDRYETSVKMAEKIGTSSKAVLATGEDFPDALSVSAAAAKMGMPILLTMKNSLPQAVSQYITSKGVSQTYVIGGAGVISDTVMYSLPNTVRLGGKDRYETNVLVLHEFAAQLDFSNVYAAVGDEFADALSGAALAAKKSAPVILANKSLSEAAANFLKGRTTLATKVTALGGEAVMPSAIADSILAFVPVAAKYDVKGTFGPAEGTQTISGNVIISADGVTLQNVVIEGDLLLAESIGNGEVTLNNITVKGTTIVKGGGPNSVIMYNFNGQTVIVDVPDGGKVRLVAQGNTSIENLEMESDGELEEDDLTGDGFINVVIPEGAAVVLNGDFDSVDVQASGANVNVESGSIGTLSIGQTASNASVSLASGTSVTSLTVDAPASVSGTGTINTATINTQGVAIAQQPKKVVVAEDVTASVGGKTVEGTPDAPSGGGGGGGSSDEETALEEWIGDMIVFIRPYGRINDRYEIATDPDDDLTWNVTIREDFMTKTESQFYSKVVELIKDGRIDFAKSQDLMEQLGNATIEGKSYTRYIADKLADKPHSATAEAFFLDPTNETKFNALVARLTDPANDDYDELVEVLSEMSIIEGDKVVPRPTIQGATLNSIEVYDIDTDTLIGTITTGQSYTMDEMKAELGIPAGPDPITYEDLSGKRLGYKFSNDQTFWFNFE